MNSTIDTRATTGQRLSRKQLAQLTGARESTIKFYSEAGLLPYDQAGEGLARRFDPQLAVPRLREIADLKTLGLDIAAIKARLAQQQR